MCLIIVCSGEAGYALLCAHLEARTEECSKGLQMEMGDFVLKQVNDDALDLVKQLVFICVCSTGVRAEHV